MVLSRYTDPHRVAEGEINRIPVRPLQFCNGGAVGIIFKVDRIGDQAADHLQINITHLKDMGADQTGVLYQ